jgi:hypothetical protein
MGSTLNSFPDCTLVACGFSLREGWVIGGRVRKTPRRALAKAHGGHCLWRTHSFAGLVVKMSTCRRARSGYRLLRRRFAIISTSPKVFALSIVIRR